MGWQVNRNSVAKGPRHSELKMVDLKEDQLDPRRSKMKSSPVGKSLEARGGARRRLRVLKD